MKVTNYKDIEKIKPIIHKTLKKYQSIILNDILESKDAPTKTGEEILIELFPINWIDYISETTVNNQYLSDCEKFAKELENIFENNIATDIDKHNNWAFIYIIF